MLFYEVVIFIAFGLANVVSGTVMKLEVNARVSKGERFTWWSRNDSDVARKYRALFPGSQLPNISRYTGWVCLALIVVMVLGSLLGR